MCSQVYQIAGLTYNTIHTTMQLFLELIFYKMKCLMTYGYGDMNTDRGPNQDCLSYGRITVSQSFYWQDYI